MILFKENLNCCVVEFLIIYLKFYLISFTFNYKIIIQFSTLFEGYTNFWNFKLCKFLLNSNKICKFPLYKNAKLLHCIKAIKKTLKFIIFIRWGKM